MKDFALHRENEKKEKEKKKRTLEDDLEKERRVSRKNNEIERKHENSINPANAPKLSSDTETAILWPKILQKEKMSREWKCKS